MAAITSSTDPSILRVAVITGGHAYDVINFHALWRSLPGVDAYVQHLDDFATSTDAVRDGYDVLVFYSMMMDGPVDEGQPGFRGRPKQVLARLGQTGQGIVLLHHALLAYPAWSHWDSVVGHASRELHGYTHDETLHFRVANATHPKGDNFMESIYLRWWGCGAFDILFGDVNIAIDPYLFGANLANAEPIYDYIFISHEHFDHCHPETLRALCQGERFKKLYVNIGCLTPQQPVDASYNGASFARDLPIDQHIPRDKIQVLYPKYRTDDVRTFPGPFEVDLGPVHVEAVESGENIRPDLPTNGYLITHKTKEVSVYHMGDLHENYPALRHLNGRVDFLVHMKLGFKDWSVLPEFIDYVQPRYWIPTHYRTDRKSDPIPEGHWPPNIDDPAAFVEDMRDHIGARTRILPFTAGVQYEVALPSKEVQWRWQWVNTWTTPPWAP